METGRKRLVTCFGHRTQYVSNRWMGPDPLGKHLEFPLQKVLICIIWHPYEEFMSVSNSGLLAVRTETLVLDGSTSSLASLVLAILVNACVINKPDHT